MGILNKIIYICGRFVPGFPRRFQAHSNISYYYTWKMRKPEFSPLHIFPSRAQKTM